MLLYAVYWLRASLRDTDRPPPLPPLLSLLLSTASRFVARLGKRTDGHGQGRKA